MSQWQASPKVREFLQQRESMRRNTPWPVVQKVRSFSGIVWKKAENKIERQRCPHAHSKPSSAKKCAESLAKRLNKMSSTTHDAISS